MLIPSELLLLQVFLLHLLQLELRLLLLLYAKKWIVLSESVVVVVVIDYVLVLLHFE